MSLVLKNLSKNELIRVATVAVVDLNDTRLAHGALLRRWWLCLALAAGGGFMCGAAVAAWVILK
jgi:hypothetical protein